MRKRIKSTLSLPRFNLYKSTSLWTVAHLWRDRFIPRAIAGKDDVDTNAPKNIPLSFWFLSPFQFPGRDYIIGTNVSIDGRGKMRFRVQDNWFEPGKNFACEVDEVWIYRLIGINEVMVFAIEYSFAEWHDLGEIEHDLQLSEDAEVLIGWGQHFGDALTTTSVQMMRRFVKWLVKVPAVRAEDVRHLTQLYPLIPDIRCTELKGW